MNLLAVPWLGQSADIWLHTIGCDDGQWVWRMGNGEHGSGGRDELNLMARGGLSGNEHERGTLGACFLLLNMASIQQRYEDIAHGNVSDFNFGNPFSDSCEQGKVRRSMPHCATPIPKRHYYVC